MPAPLSTPSTTLPTIGFDTAFTESPARCWSPTCTVRFAKSTPCEPPRSAASRRSTLWFSSAARSSAVLAASMSADGTSASIAGFPPSVVAAGWSIAWQNIGAEAAIPMTSGAIERRDGSGAIESPPWIFATTRPDPESSMAKLGPHRPSVKVLEPLRCDALLKNRWRFDGDAPRVGQSTSGVDAQLWGEEQRPHVLRRRPARIFGDLERFGEFEFWREATRNTARPRIELG